MKLLFIVIIALSSIAGTQAQTVVYPFANTPTSQSSQITFSNSAVNPNLMPVEIKYTRKPGEEYDISKSDRWRGILEAGAVYIKGGTPASDTDPMKRIFMMAITTNPVSTEAMGPGIYSETNLRTIKGTVILANGRLVDIEFDVNGMDINAFRKPVERGTNIYIQPLFIKISQDKHMNRDTGTWYWGEPFLNFR